MNPITSECIEKVTYGQKAICDLFSAELRKAQKLILTNYAKKIRMMATAPMGVENLA